MINGSSDGGDDEGDESSSSYVPNLSVTSSDIDCQIKKLSLTANAKVTANVTTEIRSVLDEFREKWHKELRSSDPVSVQSSIHNTVDSPILRNAKISRSQESSKVEQKKETEEERAERFFLQGIELEKCGKVYDALRYYRLAVQIVPDIEIRIYESTRNRISASSKNQQNNNNNENFSSSFNHNKENNNEDINDELDADDISLLDKFNGDLMKKEKLIEKATAEDDEDDRTDKRHETHISDLPMEILLYIFRWVVSSHLDLRSLEKCSACCKGFYICARDEEIWRLASLKIWGVNTGVLYNSIYTSWREMFLLRPRVHFNGCYISKTSYLRYGENSFQDQFYRPVQIIAYYRYFRFFPEGKVLMLTSAEDPAQSVGKLKESLVTGGGGGNESYRSEVLKGHYRLHGDLVIVILKRDSKCSTSGMNKKRGNTDNAEAPSTQTLYIEMQIESSIRRKFIQLHWKHYSIIQVRNKREITTEFDLTPGKYPPFWFSRVKSYHLQADEILE